MKKLRLDAATVRRFAAILLAVAACLFFAGASLAREPEVIPLVDRLPDGRRIGFWTEIRAGGGKPSLVLVDTGSKGLMIMASNLGGDVQRTGRRMKQSFLDGAVFEGEIVKARLQLGKAASTEPVFILAVEKVYCAKDRPRCPATTFWRPPLAGVMGLGLGNISSLDNPLAFFGADLSNGYILHGGSPRESSTLTLGLTPDNTRGFKMFATPQGRRGQNKMAVFFESNAVPGCISVDGPAPDKHCGKLLFDSGSSVSWLQLPKPGEAGRGKSASVPTGSTLVLSIDGLRDIRVKAGSVPWSDKIVLSRGDMGRSILGAGFFQHLDVLHDLKNHSLGFRPSR